MGTTSRVKKPLFVPVWLSKTPPLQVLNVKSKPLVRGTTALETCISDVSLKKNLLDAVVSGLKRTRSPIKQKKTKYQ